MAQCRSVESSGRDERATSAALGRYAGRPSRRYHPRPRTVVPTAFCRNVRIQFNDLSRGSPAFLCLPGWCENKSAFGRITHAIGRSQRVIALDWRGHGKSASPGAEFGLEELVDDA